MAGVPLLSANLASICMESLFYGIFLVLSVASLYILARRREELVTSPWNTGSARRAIYLTPMSVAAVCLFATNTAHWIIGVYRIFQALVVLDDGKQPLVFLGDLPQPTEVCQLSLLMASLIIGDIMLVYRLWIVWAYSTIVVIAPICSLVGLIVCTIGALYEIGRARPGDVIFDSATGLWITTNCVFTLCTNVYSTGFIIWRIWRANKQATRFGGTNLMGVLGILAESASLYTIWTILFFVTFLVKSNLTFTFSDTYCAIAGIAFMLINVRVGMGWAQRASNHSDHSSAPVFVARGHPRSYGMGGVAVNITRVVDRDDGIDPQIKFSSCSNVDLSSSSV